MDFFAVSFIVEMRIFCLLSSWSSFLILNSELHAENVARGRQREFFPSLGRHLTFIPPTFFGGGGLSQNAINCRIFEF